MSTYTIYMEINTKIISTGKGQCGRKTAGFGFFLNLYVTLVKCNLAKLILILT